MDKFSGVYDCPFHHWQGGFFGKEIYEFTNSALDPLTYSDDIMLRPDNHFMTDLGSVPKLLQATAPIWFAKDRFPRSYIFHDSGYKHSGHWVAVKGGWHFVKMTRKQVDRYLREMILAEGGSRSAANLVYAGVRAGGWASWKGK